MNADIKNAYTAAQAYLVDAPGATLSCANLTTGGYNMTNQLSCASDIAQSSGGITLTAPAGWGLTTDDAIVTYAGVITPAAL
jgi:hypothetical protein